MTIRHQQPGEKITWTNNTGSSVAVNTVVVIGACIGITAETIANGESGTVYLEGVFSGVAKTDGTAWSMGDVLDWDVSTSKFQKELSAATGDITSCVFAFADAASGDTTGTIKLSNPGVYNAS